MNPWLLVGIIVAGTTAGDILQSLEMKRHGEVHSLSGMARVIGRPMLIFAVVCMGISFFAFMSLLKVADLSFAVPATAASFVLETILARVILRESIDYRRWAGAALVACGVAMLAG